MSIDDLVKIFNIKKPDYLKIDVDGIEHLILQGGKETLSNSKSILIEITDSFIDQSSICYKIQTKIISVKSKINIRQKII